MPGTVQVSILELTGLPSSKSSSSTSIKVSLGKHTYEAEGEKCDFLLPLATLRDNLVVKVFDPEGNEIAHTGVKSRLIAEKGSWDDLFPLEGGGNVHMRLKFSLSEEERNRIRSMRESALKKKQEELLNKNNRDMREAVASSGGGNEMTSTTAISDEVNSFDIPLEASSKVMSSKSSTTPTNSSASVHAKEDDQWYNLKEQSSLEKAPSRLKEDNHPYNLKEQSPPEKTPSRPKEVDQPYNLKEQSSSEKTPSRPKEDDQPYNMKEQSPQEKAPSKVQKEDQRYKLKKQIPLQKTDSKVKDDDQRYNVKEQNPLGKTPSRVRETIAAFESSRLSQGSTTKAHSKEETSESTCSQDLGSSNFEQYKSSESDPDLLLDERQPSNSITEIERASYLINPYERISSEVSDRRLRCSCQNFRGWIFLEEAICSCIVRDNRMNIDVHGDYKLVGEVTDDELSGTTKKPESSHSLGDGSSRGPNGQVMKIVIMVGFGLLVLFTRKRKSR